MKTDIRLGNIKVFFCFISSSAVSYTVTVVFLEIWLTIQSLDKQTSKKLGGGGGGGGHYNRYVDTLYLLIQQ